MDSSEDGVFSQGPDRKKETTCGILSGENWIQNVDYMGDGRVDRSRKLFHSWARTHGRRWWSQRPAAGAMATVALPELGPRQVGLWLRQNDCCDVTGSRGRWGETPRLLPSPALQHPTCTSRWTKSLAATEVKAIGEMSVHDTEQRKSKELFWDQTGRWLAWMGIGQLGPKAFFVCLIKLGRMNQVLSF